VGKKLHTHQQKLLSCEERSNGKNTVEHLLDRSATFVGVDIKSGVILIC